jgi:hypothetical protein
VPKTSVAGGRERDSYRVEGRLQVQTLDGHPAAA